MFFVEPTLAPCMVLGMATGLDNKICVQDIGLSGKTEADGLAVGRASGFVGKVMRGLLSGEVTMEDAKLFDYMRSLIESEGLFAEPSACAAFAGPVGLYTYEEGKGVHTRARAEHEKRRAYRLGHGGSLVPEYEREKYAKTHL